jgi:ribosomal protein S8E
MEKEKKVNNMEQNIENQDVSIVNAGSVEPSVSFELITPEIAQKMLDSSVFNRTSDEKRIEHYAEALRNGSFKDFCNDCIVVYANGEFGNGHHRCKAIVRTGISATIPVIRNAPFNIGEIMDQGKNRTSANTWEFKTKRLIKDNPNFPKWKEDSEKLHYGFSGQKKAKLVTPPLIADFIIANESTLNDVATVFEMVGKRKHLGLNQTRIRAAFVNAIIVDQRDNGGGRRQDILNIASNLCNQTLVAGEPIHKFWNWYSEYQSKAAESEGYVNSHFVYAVILNAIDAQLNNKPFDDKNPEPVEKDPLFGSNFTRRRAKENKKNAVSTPKKSAASKTKKVKVNTNAASTQKPTP